jgi:hypothetical protein
MSSSPSPSLIMHKLSYSQWEEMKKNALRQLVMLEGQEHLLEGVLMCAFPPSDRNRVAYHISLLLLHKTY